MLGLDQREHAALHRQSPDLDGVAWFRSPAERAGHEDLHIARAAKTHGLLYLVFEIV